VKESYVWSGTPVGVKMEIKLLLMMICVGLFWLWAITVELRLKELKNEQQKNS